MIMESIIAYAYGRLKWKKLMLGEYLKKLDIRPKYYLKFYLKNFLDIKNMVSRMIS